MINADMRSYNFYTFGEKDKYGQPILSEEVQGTIKISINSITTTIVDNVNYSQATYIGLTRAEVNDTYVIDYKGAKLKVLYVIPKGRLKQVFMAQI